MDNLQECHAKEKQILIQGLDDFVWRTLTVYCKFSLVVGRSNDLKKNCAQQISKHNLLYYKIVSKMVQ